MTMKSTLKKNSSAMRAVYVGRMVQQNLRNLNYTNLRASWNINFGKDDRFIYLHWRPGTNFGDHLSSLLTKALSGREPVLATHVPNFRGKPIYSCIGSVLQFHQVGLSDVWGSGFIDGDRKFLFRPRRLHAVRGLLTREKALSQGLECPPLYGDPAVVAFDKMVDLPRSREFKVGLIPHYVDEDHPGVQKFSKREDVIKIDVRADWRCIAMQAMRCEVVLSSSLHGIILADALHIPNRWLGVSSLAMKDGFKFHDYFSSISRQEQPLLVGDLEIKKVLKEAHLSHVPFSRDDLLGACPFLADGYQKRLSDMAEISQTRPASQSGEPNLRVFDGSRKA